MHAIASTWGSEDNIPLLGVSSLFYPLGPELQLIQAWQEAHSSSEASCRPFQRFSLVSQPLEGTLAFPSDSLLAREHLLSMESLLTL